MDVKKSFYLEGPFFVVTLDHKLFNDPTYFRARLATSMERPIFPRSRDFLTQRRRVGRGFSSCDGKNDEK